MKELLPATSRGDKSHCVNKSGLCELLQIQTIKYILLLYFPNFTVGSYLLLNTKFHWLYSVVPSIVS